jgi:hypothetical protein
MKFFQDDKSKLQIACLLANIFLVVSFIFSEYHHSYLSIWLILTSLINMMISLKITLLRKGKSDYVFYVLNLSCFIYLFICLIFIFLIDFKLMDWGK